ncbi:histidinol-phosphate transaminase [Sedimentisphaera salicampi]|nr:histidinol-phosphate transaminase [Sedimentisphaera salicampi]
MEQMMGYFRENIENLEAYVPGYQPAGNDVIKLNTNENAYGPSPKAGEALKNFSPDELRKYPQPSADKFRKIAAEVNNVGIDNIICTNGGDELLTLAFRAFTDEKRNVCWASPTYSLYDELSGIQGCSALRVTYQPDEAVQKIAEISASLSILCNPNAPTGDFITPDRISMLAARLEGLGILLIDEAYVDFAPASCAPLVKEFDNIIVLRSMSKGYGLAGLRFGYGIVSENLLEGLNKVRDSYNVNRLSVEIASAALADQNYFRKTVEKIKQQRETLRVELVKLGFEVNKSHTNFVLAQHPEAKQIYNKLFEAGIIVRYFDLDGLRDKLRITVGTNNQNNKLLDTLSTILPAL